LEGHHVIIYTLKNQKATKLKMWFWLQGIPVTHVVTRVENVKSLPSVLHIDLIIDDCPYTVESVRRNGVNAILITNREADWTLSIRTACQLRPPLSEITL
jgi:coenzyme F420-reducing hydrogenase gamma subunit